MKTILILSYTFITIFAFAQSSYSFKQPLPPNAKIAENLSEELYGRYISYQKDYSIIVSERGLFIERKMKAEISQDELEELTYLEIKDGLLFGAQGDIGIPYSRTGDIISYTVTSKRPLFEFRSSDVLSQLSKNLFIINFNENGSYSPTLLSIYNGQLGLQHFDYSENTTIFKEVNTKEVTHTGNLYEIVMNPDIEEFRTIDLTEMFGKQLTFVKENGTIASLK